LFGFGPPHIFAALNDIRLTGAGFLSGSFILEKVKTWTQHKVRLKVQISQIVPCPVERSAKAVFPSVYLPNRLLKKGKSSSASIA
jgi:hypothetical protein